jgi:uncharacterized protein (TIGR03382 family)
MQRRISFWVAVMVCGASSVARADQFTLVDVSYTHSAETTSDSHYYVMLPADTPKDWTSPVDWSNGSVHLIVDVKTKPAGGAKTKMQVCFEGTPAYGCTLQSPTYTTTGKVEWDSPFKDFWYGGDVDWSKGIKKVPLILKDDQNNKPAGDPKYMPTDLHVQIYLVSPGAKFAPPAAGSGGTGASGTGAAGAGTGGAAAAGTGAAGAAGAANGGSGASGRGAQAGAGAGGRAGTGAGTGAASGGTGAAGTAAAAAGRSASAGSTAGAAAGSAGAAGTVTLPSTTPTAGSIGSTTSAQTERPSESSGGCRSAGTGLGGVWPFAGLLAWLALRRRRKLAPS